MYPQLTELSSGNIVVDIFDSICFKFVECQFLISLRCYDLQTSNQLSFIQLPPFVTINSNLVISKYLIISSGVGPKYICVVRLCLQWDFGIQFGGIQLHKFTVDQPCLPTRFFRRSNRTSNGNILSRSLKVKSSKSQRNALVHFKYCVIT